VNIVYLREWFLILIDFGFLVFNVTFSKKVALNTKIQIQIHTRLSPLRRGFAPHFIKYKRGCTRLAAANDKVYQLFAHGQF
jgi:hypothetical protein